MKSLNEMISESVQVKTKMVYNSTIYQHSIDVNVMAIMIWPLAVGDYVFLFKDEDLTIPVKDYELLSMYLLNTTPIKRGDDDAGLDIVLCNELSDNPLKTLKYTHKDYSREFYAISNNIFSGETYIELLKQAQRESEEEPAQKRLIFSSVLDSFNIEDFPDGTELYYKEVLYPNFPIAPYKITILWDGKEYEVDGTYDENSENIYYGETITVPLSDSDEEIKVPVFDNYPFYIMYQSETETEGLFIASQTDGPHSIQIYGDVDENVTTILPRFEFTANNDLYDYYYYEYMTESPDRSDFPYEKSDRVNVIFDGTLYENVLVTTCTEHIYEFGAGTKIEGPGYNFSSYPFCIKADCTELPIITFYLPDQNPHTVEIYHSTYTDMSVDENVLIRKTAFTTYSTNGDDEPPFSHKFDDELVSENFRYTQIKVIMDDGDATITTGSMIDQNTRTYDLRISDNFYGIKTTDYPDAGVYFVDNISEKPTTHTIEVFKITNETIAEVF